MTGVNWFDFLRYFSSNTISSNS